jgi:hypothetical protein
MKPKDRGIIKWQPFMMPEHNKLLRNLAEEQNRIDKPILDEYELEEINQKLILAFEDKLPVKIKVFSSGYVEVLEGLILKLDPINKSLRLETKDGLKTIKFDDILSVQYE